MRADDFTKSFAEAQRNWRDATPACLQPLRGDFFNLPQAIMHVLLKAYPDTQQLILAVLEWFGHGYGTWGNFPEWEEEAENVLEKLPLNAINSVVENDDLNRYQLEGAARFFAGGSDYLRLHGRLKPKRTSPQVKKRLLAYCLSTGDHDKIVRGRRAFDDELMQILDSKNTQKVIAKVAVPHHSFSFNLLQRISPDKNTFVSSFSIYLALAVLYNGAKNETQQAIARVLGVQRLSLQEFNRANHLLQTMLTIRDTSFQLSIANGLWVQQGIALATDFQECNREFYDTETAELDFADSGAPAVIDAWVKRHTGGKIPQIDVNLDPLTIMVLANAIYFEANWTKVFSKEKTRDGSFTLLDGTIKQVPLLSKLDYLGYFATEAFESIRLPYGQGSVSMVIFLPSKTSSLKAFWQILTSENWTTWMSQYKYDHGTITMPRFKFDYAFDLKEALAALGMSIAFDAAYADFKGITTVVLPFWLSEAKHKTFVQVDEEGTKAAAVTWSMFFAGGMPSENFNMVVDRPFFFAIQDDKTGTILFMGSVVDPVWQD